MTFTAELPSWSFVSPSRQSVTTSRLKLWPRSHLSPSTSRKWRLVLYVTVLHEIFVNSYTFFYSFRTGTRVVKNNEGKKYSTTRRLYKKTILLNSVVFSFACQSRFGACIISSRSTNCNWEKLLSYSSVKCRGRALSYGNRRTIAHRICFSFLWHPLSPTYSSWWVIHGETASHSKCNVHTKFQRHLTKEYRE